VRTIADNRDPKYKTQLTSAAYLEAAQNMVKNKDENLPIRYDGEERYGTDNWQIRRMLLDMDTYLPGDILCKVDRASMKYSLEARCPILDTEMMEYSFRIPHKYKYCNGDKKHILKDIAYDYIPKEKLDRPKKGFGVPLDKWLMGPLKNEMMDYINEDYIKKQGLFDPGYTRQFIMDFLKTGDNGASTGANFSSICWSYYVFQQWYQEYKSVISC
jgi:asparagine synthase (glutamine-hydrolysing)